MSSHVHIISYLESRLAACRARPELHRHQIDAYERLLDVARAAPDPTSYQRELAARGLTLATMRAEWLDRYHAVACVYRALGDETQRRSAAARFHAGQQRDFLAAIGAAEQQSAATTAAARAGQEALAPLLISLLHWRIEDRDEPRRQRLREVHGLWGIMQGNDPGCTWERVCTYRPYRDRIPFDSAGLAMLGDWLAQALASIEDAPETAPAAAPFARATEPDEPDEPDEPAALAGPDEPEEVPERAAPAPASEPVQPTARTLAQPYHVIYDAEDWTGRDRARRAYERIFALEDEVASEAEPGDGAAFLWRMAEGGLLTELARAPHLDWAEELQTHGQSRSQPVMTHHAGALATAIAASPTPTAVEHERRWLDACFDAESAWDQLFLHYALSPITAVLARGGSGAGQAVRESARVVAALFGANWDALLATPRLREFFERELVPALFGQQPVLGARRGEVGGTILQAAAGFTPKPDGTDPAEVRAHLAALVSEALGGSFEAPAPGAGRALVLWGRPVTLDQVPERLAAPPRPPVALDDAAATAMSAVSPPHLP